MTFDFLVYRNDPTQAICFMDQPLVEDANRSQLSQAYKPSDWGQLPIVCDKQSSVQKLKFGQNPVRENDLKIFIFRK